MFDPAITGPFFADAQEIARDAAAAKPARGRRPEVKSKDDDDDDGPNPTAGAIARLFPFFRPRPLGGFALA